MLTLTGFSVAEKRRITKMEAKADAWWSYDAVEWTKISYEEGGGTNTVPYYSSQEWSQTIVNTRTAFLGLWGLTVQSFNESTGRSYPGDLVLIAGDYDGGGSFSSSTYRSLPGLYCDVNGVTCNGRGTCSVSGCECDPDYAGFLCEEDNTNVVSSASRCFNSESWMLTSVIVLLSAALLI